MELKPFFTANKIGRDQGFNVSGPLDDPLQEEETDSEGEMPDNEFVRKKYQSLDSITGPADEETERIIRDAIKQTRTSMREAAPAPIPPDHPFEARTQRTRFLTQEVEQFPPSRASEEAQAFLDSRMGAQRSQENLRARVQGILIL